MANTFRLKRSAVQGRVPTTGDLQLGELGLNTYDGKLYTLKNDGVATIVQIGATATTLSSLTFNNGGSGGASGSTFDGNTALTVSYNTIGAPSTTGTNASGSWGISITGNAATATQVTRTVTGTNSGELVRGNMADNDQFRILVGGTASNAGFAEIATADDGTEPIHVRQYTGVFTTLVRTATLLDGSGNTTFPGTVQGTRFISTVAAGTAPFTVTSNTLVTNLNADLLDGLDSTAFLRSNANNTSTGDIFTTGWLEAGRTSGSIALTANDGYGNANITFNHKSGIPDATGNSARITSNVDATSGATMGFQLKSTTTLGVAVALTEVLTLAETTATFIGTVSLGSQASLAGHAVRADRSLTISGTTNQVNVSLAGAQNLTADRSWTLSLPQNIHTAATPTFGGLTVTSTAKIGSVINIVPYDTLNNGTLSFEGSAGQLFSITNNLTSGSIFSVNDVSGIPSLDVDANGTVSMASFGGNVGVGTTSPTTKLQVGVKVIDDNSYVYNTDSLYVVNQTPTSTTVLNDPQDVLVLSRQGTANQAFGAAAAFRLSRYENSGTNSRTRLDITLANSNFLASAIIPLTLLSSGRVGVGTISPVAKLDVEQVVGDPWVQITSIEKSNNTVGSAPGAEFIGSRGDGNGTFYGRLCLGFRRNSGTAIASAQGLGGILFGGQHGTGTTYDAASVRYAGSIVAVAEGSFTSATAMPVAITFRTGSSGDDAKVANGVYGTERMRIDSSGRVGIGTTTPGSSLTVQTSFDGTNVVGSFRNIANLSSNTATAIELVADQATARITALRDGAGTSATMVFGVAVAGTVTERARITSDGRLGVGSNNPGGLVEISSNAPTVVDTTTLLQRTRSNAGNGVFLDTTSRRHTTGSDWTGVSLRLQQQVDSTLMGYLEFNPLGASQGIAIGHNNTARLTVTSAGNVGIGLTNPSFNLDVSGNVRLGSNVSGVTTTPPYLHLGANWSSTALRANCKLRLYDNGSGDVYGFNIGNGGDVQYHSTTTHQFYNSDVATLLVNNTAPSYKGNTIWHVGNDGAASGLDADLLDGNQGSYFLDTSATTQLKSGALRIGGAASRSSSGLTVGFTNNTAFAINTDIGDSSRTISVVNESTTTNAMAVLGFRINPNGGATNAMVDIKFVQTGGANTSALHYSFNHGGSFVDRLTVLSSGNVGIGTINPTYRLEVAGSFAATTKSFVIPHPTKEGYKLRYGSLEGPENGVYIRGRSKDFVIELPEYWTELVDSDSITVNLTPIGKTQTLWVKDIRDNKIYIGSKCSEINYFYTVFGERADVEKLEVEIPAN
jgi:hypothetical protein